MTRAVSRPGFDGDFLRRGRDDRVVGVLNPEVVEIDSLDGVHRFDRHSHTVVDHQLSEFCAIQEDNPRMGQVRVIVSVAALLLAGQQPAAALQQSVTPAVVQRLGDLMLPADIP